MITVLKSNKGKRFTVKEQLLKAYALAEKLSNKTNKKYLVYVEDIGANGHVYHVSQKINNSRFIILESCLILSKQEFEFFCKYNNFFNKSGWDFEPRFNTYIKIN